MMSLHFIVNPLMPAGRSVMTLFLRPATRLLALMTFLLSLMPLQTTVAGTPLPKTQYCSREVFEVSCRPGEVILMKSASYGRMRSGICIGKISLGCTNDVLPYMDSICSGRSHCRLEVNDLEKVTQPCSRDYKSYLEAKHECVPVVSSNECTRDAVVVRGLQGYILGNATSTASRRMGMHHHCSYTINVKPGQRVNVYLHNFALHPTKLGPVWPPPRSPLTSIQSSSHSCSGFLTVEDHSSKKRIDLCADVFPERRNLIFTSSSNSVSLHHTVRPSLDDPPVLLSYQAWGCPDLDAPSFGWVERRGHDAIVRCNTSGDVWYLTCSKENAWLGEYGNCTSGAVYQPQDDFFGDGIPFQQAGLALAVGVGVIVGTILGAILLVCVYTVRKGRREAAAAEARAKQHNNTFPRYVDEERLHYPSLLQGGDKTADPSLFEYTHVWDSRVQCLEKKPPTCKPSASPFSGASVTIETPLPATGSGPSAPGVGTRVTFDPTQRKLHIYDTSPPRGEDPNKRSRVSSDIPMYFDLDPDSKFEMEKMGTLRKADI